MDLAEFGDLFSFGDDFSPIMMLVWIIPIVFFVFYGQQIQLYISANQIKKQIFRLKEYRDESKDELVNYVKERMKASSDSPSRIETFLDYFSIMPSNMDPGGIVPKVRHVVRSREEHTREQIRILDPTAGELQRTQAQTLLEIASSLRLLHRITNHVYLTAKKQKNFPMILPLQMMLPFIMEEAKALRGAVSAFKLGQPIGDGIGPMVVGRMMVHLQKETAAFQTVWSQTLIDKRRVYLMKAQGPLSSVGRPGDAVENLLRRRKMDAIIMIDAALKMEGEESAVVSRGFGAAIGGIGTERFQIEEIATKRGIPIYAIVVKQSIKEALALMTKEVALKASSVRSQVGEMIREAAPEGGSVLVVGVGNTVGVSQ